MPTRYRVKAYVQLTYSQPVEHHTVRRYRNHPTRVMEHRRFQVNYTLDTEVIDPREDPIKGLIRLLSMGLRLLTLVEFQVRQALADHQETLPERYSGNPKRPTARPTAELLLASFRDITLVMVSVRGQTYADQTELTPLQRRILKILSGGEEIGFDGGKKVKGRKCTILVDTMDLLLGAYVHSA